MNRFLILLLFSISLFTFSQPDNKKLDSLKHIYKNSASEKNKVTALTELVKEYFDANRDSAEVYINKTISFTENKPHLHKPRLISFLNYAQIYIIKGDYKTSEAYYAKSWEILKNNYYYDLYIKYFGDKGVLNFYQGDFKSALSNFNKALEKAKEEKNEEDQLTYLNNKALAMSYLNEAEASLDVHREAISLAEKLNDSTALGKSFNNIGLIYEDMKAYNKALEFYSKALNIKKNGNNKIDIANSLFNIAGMYKEIGEKEKDTTLYAKAEKHFKLAFEKAKEVNYGKVMLFSKTGMAQLATVRNKPLKAISIYKSVVDEARRVDDNQTLRATYLNLGVNYLSIGKLREAETYLLKSKPFIEAAENPSDIASLYKNLSLLYQQKQNYNLAYNYFKEYHGISEDLSKNSLTEKISEFEIKYETEKKEKEIVTQRAELIEKELRISKKNTQLMGLGLVAILLSVLGYLLYNQQKLKNRQLQKESELKEALARIETQNKLQDQRLKISRDLHDNIGAQLTFIISSIENLQYGFEIKNEKLTKKLKDISAFTKETIYELRDTIWAMNKSEISLEDLQTRISNFVENANTHSGNINFKFILKDTVLNSTIFSSVTGMNVYRIVQEAINNAIKYSEAKNVTVEIFQNKEQLVIKVVDDGKGFDITKAGDGNGLNNIQKRAKDIKATLNIISKINVGTQIELYVGV
ncbi:Tetratricopeptide repeat-containing protein [Hyunsoonleella jejuensis]|uniref:histidine kinase n=1 Tax=Hyunsoonleella jejuensis TaxID=419940 RepID=A0A1H9KZR9_9FLAO|nr:sensor histidine kinase [Hyunsoonleella jejuensis]SER04646.1 Tetratricopeptide repeat-containing protein [Hyunsoonleella jejuensis]